MKTSRTRRAAASFAEVVTALLLLSSGAQAEKTASAPAKPSAPTAKPAAPAGGRGTAAGARGSAAPARGSAAPARGSVAPATPAGGARGGPAGRPTPAGERTETRPGGASVTRRADGRVADLHTRTGADIHHGLNGHTAVMHEGPDHSRVFVERGGRGYVQHPYAFRGHEYAARTYYFRGRRYERFYRGYRYRGAYLEVYSPVAFYPVGFYGWAYNPWVTPVPYAWGWAGDPWFGYYGAYFTPYPVYTNASLWLTDYLISQSLADAYQANLAAQTPMNDPLPAGQVALTPDVKQMVADEVRRQIALENADAQTNAQNAEPDPGSSGIARMLSDNTPHVFVVGDDLDVVEAGSGQECAVTQGDVLALGAPPPPNATTATLVVMGSKGGVECRKGSAVQIALADLQAMQNYMRETVDAGLADLQAHKGGLPTPPPSALAPATPAAFSVGAPPPDQTVDTQITQQFQQGTQEELAMLSQPAAPPAAIPAPSAPKAVPARSGPPATVSLGQTTDQVVAAYGQPKNIVDLGPKKIYVYQDIKVTLNNGKVIDIE